LFDQLADGVGIHLLGLAWMRNAQRSLRSRGRGIVRRLTLAGFSRVNRLELVN